MRSYFSSDEEMIKRSLLDNPMFEVLSEFSIDDSTNAVSGQEAHHTQEEGVGEDAANVGVALEEGDCGTVVEIQGEEVEGCEE